MQVAFRSSFVRDLKKLKSQSIRNRVRKAIEQVEHAVGIAEIDNLKKLGGADNYFRIRVGDYRIGLVFENGQVEFVRCLPRRDLYRFFP